jgi:hypothetical protein
MNSKKICECGMESQVIGEEMPSKPGFSTQVVDFPHIVGGKKIKQQAAEAPSRGGNLEDQD